MEIKKLHAQLGNTMIYVTHDQIEAMTLADRIAVMKGGRIQQLAPPHEIYNRPANRFVAGFLGSPAMNFLDGRIVEGKAVEVGRVKIPLGRYAASGALPPPGTPVTLGVRPEHIQVLAESHGEGGRYVPADGRIVMLEPTGADTIVWTNLGGLPLTIRVDGETPVRLDQTIRYAIDLDRASLFVTETGERV